MHWFGDVPAKDLTETESQLIHPDIVEDEHVWQFKWQAVQFATPLSKYFMLQLNIYVYI